MIGWFVRLIDNNEAEVFNGGEEGAAWADNDLRSSCLKRFLPELMANGFGLLGMEQDNIFKEVLEVLDELRGEGDFWNEQNDGFARGELALGEFDIDIGFAGAGDAM